jgi:hypothetical protein
MEVGEVWGAAFARETVRAVTKIQASEFRQAD